MGFTPEGPQLCVRPYTHTDHYWQVYFDTHKAILQTCEESLRRLRTDRIDLYWMHLWDPLTPMEETLRALDDLVRAGKILHIGFSNTPAWKIAEARWLADFRGQVPVVGLQSRHSWSRTKARRPSTASCRSES